MNKKKVDYFTKFRGAKKGKTMLELSKKILKKVSFDKLLFQKELKKALKWITDAEEAKMFKEFCIKEFYHLHPTIIKKTFAL